VDGQINSASLTETVEPKKLVRTCRTGGDPPGDHEFARLSVGLASCRKWILEGRKMSVIADSCEQLDCTLPNPKDNQTERHFPAQPKPEHCRCDMMITFWVGHTPKRCELCGSALKFLFVRGKTVWGTGVVMCPKCLDDCGRGIGPGKGQLYLKVGGKRARGRPKWMKIAG